MLGLQCVVVFQLKAYAFEFNLKLIFAAVVVKCLKFSETVSKPK